MVVRGGKTIERKFSLRDVTLAAALLAISPLPLLGAPSASAQQAEWEIDWQGQSRAQGAQSTGAQPTGTQRAGPLPAIVTIQPPRRPAELAASDRPAQDAAPASATQTSAVQASPAEISAPAVVQASAPAQPAAAAAPAPMQLAAASSEPVAVAVANTSLSDAEVVARANDYFNAITMMSGRFTQVGANGSRVTGTLYVHRPGRVRFAYDEPATIDVISDGRSVAVRDRRLATQDLYPVSQTPLKFLIGDRVELGRTIPVIGVERTNNETDVILQDSTTFGGTSRITLTFDAQVRELKQWRIMDPQGFETTVTLSGLNRSASVDPNLFVINYQPVW
jgi:outer membrane lipoprotein-sorting protein